ncbi:MAG: FAD binding domain-containing protein, partial [Firmicutes bacterium]|nr:FAD binding domain-containing protein [Bacillota bacterium]
PAAELPTVAVALGAELEALGPAGIRTIPVEEFLQGFLMTDLRPDEVITAVRWPIWSGRTGASFQEVARRQGDLALVAVAVQLALDESGKCTRAAVALGGVGPRPIRALATEEKVVGKTLDGGLIEAAAQAAAEEIEPESDLHASAEYRRRVATALTRRALEQAAQRARGGLNPGDETSDQT